LSEPDALAQDAETCLHCDINDLVQERLEQGETDIAEIAMMIVESLADVIVLAPESEHSRIFGHVVAHLGGMFLEKTGAVSSPSDARH
jgi:hypothetical protein